MTFIVRTLYIFSQGALYTLLIASLLLSANVWAQSAAPVEVTRVERAAVYEIERVSGSVISEENANLSIRTAGLISHLAVDIGTQVRKGDVLLELDTDLIAQQLRVAEAEVAEAQSAQQDAEQQLTELDALQAQQNVAASEVRRARAQLAIVTAASEAAKARYQQVQTEQAHHQLRAPFSGWVVARQVDLGEWVNPGDVVYHLINPTQVFADFYIPQDRYAAMRDEVDIVIKSQHQGAQSYSANLHRIAPYSSQTTRTFLTRVKPAEEFIKRALIGATVTAEFRFKQPDPGLVIPRDAVLRYPDGRTAAWIVREEDKEESEQGSQTVVAERFIELDTEFDGMVEVTSGLSAGDTVVIKGNESLIDGQRVRIQTGSEASRND